MRPVVPIRPADDQRTKAAGNVESLPRNVIPAKAGIQCPCASKAWRHWIPAFAGMTSLEQGFSSSQQPPHDTAALAHCTRGALRLRSQHPARAMALLRNAFAKSI